MNTTTLSTALAQANAGNSKADYCYYLKSHKGYWKPGGLGYTQEETEAGVFTCETMKRHNLDGVTLISAD